MPWPPKLSNPVLESHTVPLELLELLRRTNLNHNVNLVSNDEEALYAASYKGHVNKVKRLIKNGANVNLVNPHNGETPLYAACCKGHTEIVKRLIKNGAN
ncbi:MAG: ankyrin repeat domain-containing protein, partial [Gammaproteobacteria bacterium]|nr:ankyrin repeat domain-containing protein [Gammaproteobacteria bacterium]